MQSPSASLSGLSSAQAVARLSAVGPNRIAQETPGARIREALRTFADPMALMLAAAVAVYFALGETTDAVVLLIALVPVLGVDVILEARSRRALKQLAMAVAPRARVIRDGAEIEIATDDIVPGDILLIVEGGMVHADGVLRTASHLSVDESQLTGEAEPSDKQSIEGDADISRAPGNCRVYAGSRVISGHGYAEIVATGDRSQFGNLARLVAEAEARPTPLQRKTARLARWLAGVAIVVSAGLFVLWIARGAAPASALLYSISLAMSAVSEEFLLVLTLFLSLGAWRLSRLGVLVRRLASVETLGATTVICLDKTGTLTAGEFGLAIHIPLNDSFSEDELLEAAALACEPDPADSMERAIVAHCASHKVDVGALHERWELVYDHPFELAGKHMSHVWRSRGGNDPRRDRIVVKGALEGVLEHCATSRAEIENVKTENERLAGNAMRVLAVAGRETKLGEPSLSGVRTEDERNLRLYGLLGFEDPMRPEVPSAVAECQAAGIRLKLITGDHALTAHAVCDAAGLAHQHDGIITGSELDVLPEAEFAEAVRRCAIFARVRPEQKFAIVDALERAGEIVAMTGDGINDAPALRRADIGVSMGRRATEIARSIADLVLLEDNFSAMAGTIREGRLIYSNLQRAFLYLVGFKAMLVVMALAAPLAGLPILLPPVCLVWLELIVHPVSAIAFEGEDTDQDVMRRPPRAPSEPILRRGPAFRAGLSGVLVAIAALVMYALRLNRGENYARGVAITVAIAGSLMLVWAAFAGERPWWRAAAPRTAKFWIVIATVAASLPLFMETPPIASILLIAPISPGDWAIAICAGMLAAGWNGFRCSAARKQPPPAPAIQADISRSLRKASFAKF
ncbi:MAG TPA: cation-transporting P-type ATPase [Candidatus Binataceae bacterium]|nr:cation-transporting P-type ATPase [Candidatus Binataceae bacterium]